jgi:hypothetical protein
MTARIIDGKARADRLSQEIRLQVAARVEARKPVPGLRWCKSATTRRRRYTSGTSGG